MKDSKLFYQESRSFNIPKQMISLFICVILALILGYLYSVLMLNIPFIYIKFLITIGLGTILGFVCSSLIKFSHSRSKKNQLLMAFFVGLIANYFQWTTYIVFLIHGEIPSLGVYLQNLHWILFPSDFFDILLEINKVGTFSIRNINIFGSGLTIIWVIEFFIIILIPMFTIYKSSTLPYSEKFQKWHQKYTLNQEFEVISSANSFTEELTKDTLKTIESLGSGIGYRYSKIHLYYLKEEDSNYLTFEKTFIENRGRGKKISTIIIENFKINQTTAASILKKYPNKLVGFEFNIDSIQSILKL